MIPQLEEQKSDTTAHLRGGSESRMAKVAPLEAHDNNGNNVEERERKPRQEWMKKVEAFLDSAPVQIVMACWTVYALFSDDLRMLAFSSDSDSVFYSLTIIAMAFFTVEIVLSSIFVDEYFLGFFFWLDVIATVSLIVDIGWIVPETSDVGDAAADIAKQARAGRAARILRMIRLVRLTRISKLYKEVQQRREMTEKQQPTTRRLSLKELCQKQAVGVSSNPLADRSGANTEEKEEVPKETRLGRVHCDVTTQRVIVIVLVLVFFLPMLERETYWSAPYSALYLAKALSQGHPAMPSASFQSLCQSICNEAKEDDYYPLIYISGPDCGPFSYETDHDELRESEKMEVTEGEYTLIADVRNYTRLLAGLSIGRTIFLCIILAVGAVAFAYDTTKLVIFPLESMIERVRVLAKDPMAFCLTENEEELGMYSLQGKVESRELGKQYESHLLNNLIVKIAHLLAVEYGEAGTRIISENLSTGEFLNPMLPGSKMTAVFGFVIINSFAEVTEVLQSRIIIFLNQVAEVLHATVDKYLGSTNKNIGEAFLLLWKLPENSVEYTKEGPVPRSQAASTIVDLALFSYLKTIAKMNKLNHILEFNSSPEIKGRLPNFKLKLGFGLHVGWAIEGAIGSVHKIDASYLSPNVNISARLEAATKQYGVPILLSGQIYNMLSPSIQTYCREVDTVTVKGSKLPLKLYTVDLSLQSLQPKDCKYAGVGLGMRKAKRLANRKRFHADVKNGRVLSRDLYWMDKDLNCMRAGISAEFQRQFSEGYRMYLSGEWRQATEHLKSALVMTPNDGPSRTLVSYMEARACTPPASWAGFRELTEK